MQEYNHAERSPLRSGNTVDENDRHPRARDHIRILRLFPGIGDADLEGNIITQPIRSEHAPAKTGLHHVDYEPYEALSYSWGSEAPINFVKIVAESQSYRIAIRPNLDQALRQLRYVDRPRNLWCDAICINQKDEAEKSEQIPQMSWIYSRASSVAVWLGEEANNSREAMDFVRNFLKLDNFDHLVRDELTSKDWAALAELMRRPWFSRRWIIQEISTARSATLYCGNDSISWREFADGVSLFASKRHELRELFRKSSAHSNHPDYLGELSELGAIRLVYASDNLFRKNGEGKIVEHLFSLEALMSSMSSFEASDPHDIIYAIIWLANDAKPVDRKAPFAQGMRPAHLRSPVASPALPAISPAIASISRELKTKVLNGTATPNHTEPTPISLPNGHHLELPQSTTDRLDPEAGASDTISGGVTVEEPQSYDLEAPHLGVDPIRRARTDLERRDSVTQRKLERYLLPIMEKRLDKKKLTSHNPADPSEALSIAGAMWKDAMKHRNIYVDYSKSVFDVCKDFLEFVINRTQSLDMVCRPWAPDDPSLPSWIPPLSRGAFAPGIRRVHRRVNADPLVGEPGNGLRPYRASSSRQAKWEVDPVDGRTLRVTGFELDVIYQKFLPASAGIIPAQWMSAGGWCLNEASDLPRDEFWRTLVGNRTSDGRRPPSHWQRICADAFRRRPNRGDLNTTETILYDDCPSVVREFLERVQCVVWSRRLVLLREMPDSLALVPANAKKGDIICILDGCSVPVVLRRFVDGKPAAKKHTICDHPHCPTNRRGATIVHKGTHGHKIRLDTGSFHGEHYEFIGECYVHGMMDGEAFNEMRERKLRTESFNLR